MLVEGIAVGVCGTDVEIVEGKYGWAPPGRARLVLGHESLGRVLDPGPTGEFREGDLVAGIVRRPDPVPCSSCAVGEWDMCRNGQYTERGIKALHGFAAERFRLEPEFAVRVRSEEHTSELQSLRHLVCRLLLEKKKIKKRTTSTINNEGHKYRKSPHDSVTIINS